LLARGGFAAPGPIFVSADAEIRNFILWTPQIPKLPPGSRRPPRRNRPAPCRKAGNGQRHKDRRARMRGNVRTQGRRAAQDLPVLRRWFCGCKDLAHTAGAQARCRGEEAVLLFPSPSTRLRAPACQGPVETAALPPPPPHSFARAALAGWPRDLIACMLIEGNVMGSAGRSGGARSAYGAALAAGRAAAASGVGGAWLRICEGHALARLGRAGEAEAGYGAARDESPESAVVHPEMGNLLMGEGRLEEADASYKRSAELDPRYAPACVARGHSLLIQPGGDGALAVERHSGALVLDPDGVSAHMGRGMAMARLGRHDRAAAQFRKAADFDADDMAPLVALGGSLSAPGRHDKAIEAFESAILTANEAGFDSAARRGAEAEMRRGADPIRSGLGAPSAYMGLAGALSRTGRLKDAAFAYLRATWLDAGSAEARAGLVSIQANWFMLVGSDIAQSRTLQPRS